MKTIAFYTLGSRTKPTLLILHGWGLQGEKYRTLATLLSQGFFVIVPDFPGFGATPVPVGAFTVDNYVESVRMLLKNEKKKTELRIIGHSFGGRVAIKWAANYPEEVKAVILTGSPGVEEFLWKRSLKRALVQIAAKSLKIFTFLPPVRRLKDRFYKNRDIGKLEGVMRETFLLVIREKLTSSFKKIKAPLLLLWGSQDQMVLVKDAEKMLKLSPHCNLKIFAKVGHGLPYERPHEFVREALDFFEKHS